ncbi:MAG: DUF2721 domain-containing protein [Thermoanaerobaculia bacterium]
MLLSMTNRYGRTIDRARELAYSRRHPDEERDRARIEKQIEILWKRAQILRRAIFFGTLSVLWAAILIISLFITELLHVDAGWLLGLIFVACLASLILSLMDSIRDVNVSLVAVRLEIER